MRTSWKMFPQRPTRAPWARRLHCVTVAHRSGQARDMGSKKGNNDNGEKVLILKKHMV